MYPKHEGLLEQGHWEEIKPDWKPSAKARAAKWSMDIVRPSLLTRTKGAPREQLKRTAYLDGLRGFAAFMVYWHHHQLWAHDNNANIFQNGYGYDKKYYFACLPGIRTFFTGGHAAVPVFLVISGYVLSAKPMSLIQAGEYVRLGDNVASALFRRWLRLYIPFMCTTFLYMTSWHAFGLWTDDSIHSMNYRDEIWRWYCEFKNFSFVWNTSGDPFFPFNKHLWTIPVEFRGSIVIYTVLLAFSRCRRNARLWCEIGLIFYFMYIADGWFCSMFVMGMLLCDLDLLALSDNLPRLFSRLEPVKDLIFYSLFFIGLYLSGVPSQSQDIQVLKETPGWARLSVLKPQAVFDLKWFYLFWAATFLVASIPRIWWLKGFFEMRFNQYLGRISFALYLVHGPVLWTLGDRLYVAVGWVRESHGLGLPTWINIFPMSKAGPLGLELAFWAPNLIILPVTLWVAEVVTKLFDEPSVRFAQWAYGKTLAPSAKL